MHCGNVATKNDTVRGVRKKKVEKTTLIFSHPLHPPKMVRASLLWAAGLVALLSVLVTNIPTHFHLIPANSLPPGPVWSVGFSLLAAVDSVMRALTPPNLYLFKELMGYLHTVEIYSAAELRVADAIEAHVALYFPNGGASPATGVPVAALAAAVAPGCESMGAGTPGECKAVASRLSRLLRATSAYGVFRETPQGSDAWVNTPSSTFLRESHPYSLRPAALNFGRTQYAMMARLPEAIVTGTAAFAQVHGGEFWGWYKAHPQEHAIFDGTMNALGKLGAADRAIAEDFPWGTLAATVVDVGGGTGEMAATVLLACPTPPQSAIIFDMPDVIARSVGVWKGVGGGGVEEGAGVGSGSTHLAHVLATHPTLPSRVSHVGGDMFDAATIPSPPTTTSSSSSVGGHHHYAYMLRDILHDWPDEDCVRTLAALKGAMAGDKGSSIAIVARMIVPGAGFIKSLGSTDADIVMLGAFGTTAGERTKEQYVALFTAAGLKLESVTPTRSQYYILVAKAA